MGIPCIMASDSRLYGKDLHLVLLSVLCRRSLCGTRDVLCRGWKSLFCGLDSHFRTVNYTLARYLVVLDVCFL